MAFRFRQFTIEDKNSTLRVGTDAMLLGSWANPGAARKILDIGTGCGVLALMMAQKSTATIDAIEIDEPSALQARNNFEQSPWHSRISAIHNSIQAFSRQAVPNYDFIITNPPYYSNSLKSPSARTNQTRHDHSLSMIELAPIVSKLLIAKGCFALILPGTLGDRFQMMCREHNLHLSRKMMICSKPAQPPKRALLEFTKDMAIHPEISALTILDISGRYTPEYLSLTKCYHSF